MTDKTNSYLHKIKVDSVGERGVDYLDIRSLNYIYDIPKESASYFSRKFDVMICGERHPIWFDNRKEAEEEYDKLVSRWENYLDKGDSK